MTVDRGGRVIDHRDQERVKSYGKRLQGNNKHQHHLDESNHAAEREDGKVVGREVAAGSSRGRQITSNQ